MLHAKVLGLISEVGAARLFSKRPTISFYPEEEICSHCGVPLQVQKTRKKKVVTLIIGAFFARETRLYCRQCHSIFSSKFLRRLVPKKGTFGFDVIVYVGRALFIRCRSEQEIIRELAEKNVFISEREVSYLGKKFIASLALAHSESNLLLKNSMTQRGGYILHVDGTSEGDSPHLFTGLDGLSQWVLHTIKIPTENKEQLIPFFRHMNKQYGPPVALVHDLGKAIIAAISVVFPNVLDFICHFHLLRDIGKDLFGKEYQAIRNRLKASCIRSLLRKKRAALFKKIEDKPHLAKDLNHCLEKGQLDMDMVKHFPVVSAYAMILWAFNVGQQSAGYGFPFDYPHLIFYQRLKSLHLVLGRIKEIDHPNKENNNCPFYQLWRLLDVIMKDEKLTSQVAAMEEKVEIFHQLRQALHIALPDGKDGLNSCGEDVEIKTIEKSVKKFCDQVKRNKQLSTKKEVKKMLAQIYKYWEKLFAAPISVNTPNGPTLIVPQRTNNILERFFRSLKRGARKKSGTASLSKTLKAILAETPLVKNLENEEYMKIILGDCSSLEERFSRLDCMQVSYQLNKSQKTTEKISLEMKLVFKRKNLPQLIAGFFAA